MPYGNVDESEEQFALPSVFDALEQTVNAATEPMPKQIVSADLDVAGMVRTGVIVGNTIKSIEERDREVEVEEDEYPVRRNGRGGW